jgi:hypothetical protein
LHADDWKRRLSAVSSAQAKYLWALVVLGIFYFVLQRSLGNPIGADRDAVELPVLGIPLPVAAISLAAPSVLFFVLLVVMGSMRAYRTAETKATSPGTPSEAIDASPNPLDLAVYTTTDSPTWLQRVLVLTYPLFLSVFAAEATWILLSLFKAPDGLATWLFRLLGVLTGIPALVLLLRLWHRALRRVLTGSAA